MACGTHSSEVQWLIQGCVLPPCKKVTLSHQYWCAEHTHLCAMQNIFPYWVITSESCMDGEFITQPLWTCSPQYNTPSSTTAPLQLRLNSLMPSCAVIYHTAVFLSFFFFFVSRCWTELQNKLHLKQTPLPCFSPFQNTRQLWQRWLTVMWWLWWRLIIYHLSVKLY